MQRVNEQQTASLELEEQDQGVIARLVGDWRIAHLPLLKRCIEPLVASQAKQVILDGSRLDSLDAAGSMVLSAATQGKEVELKEFDEFHQRLLELVDSSTTREKLEQPKPHGFLWNIGRVTVDAADKVKGITSFIGYTAVEFSRSVLNPKRFRPKEVFVQLEHTCLNAIPITCLLIFLIGVVIAYLSATQIEKYGANIFIVDAVSITMCRELSPILVAVLVAGRSGSAFTAQLGAMKINEELDAITSLGLSPMRVLVLPRVIALMIAMPILVFIGDIVGIFGGYLIADFRLNISSYTFIDRMHAVLTLKHFFVGLVKAPVFAVFIALIGCREGLQVSKNARSLGLSTTSTVVQSIVAVILLNAAFAIIFVELGI